MAQPNKSAGTLQAAPGGPTEIPTYKTIEGWRVRLTSLDGRLLRLRAEGDALVARFAELYPDAPVYLVRYVDRTLNDYRWRRSSAKRWRAPDARPKVNVSIDLTSDVGLALLEPLPSAVRKNFLAFEAERIVLNYRIATAKYKRMRVRDLIRRMEILRQAVNPGSNPS